jgi:hypothetical protein
MRKRLTDNSQSNSHFEDSESDEGEGVRLSKRNYKRNLAVSTESAKMRSYVLASKNKKIKVLSEASEEDEEDSEEESDEEESEDSQEESEEGSDDTSKAS